MRLRIQIIIIILTLLLLIQIIRTVKKGKLRSDYALGWIISICALLIVVIFPWIINSVTELVGVYSPTNMIFALIIFILILLVYSLMCRLSALEESSKNLIQEVALLEKQLEDKEKLSNKMEKDNEQ